VCQIADLRQLVHGVSVEQRDRKVQHPDQGHYGDTPRHPQLHRDGLCILGARVKPRNAPKPCFECKVVLSEYILCRGHCFAVAVYGTVQSLEFVFQCIDKYESAFASFDTAILRSRLLGVLPSKVVTYCQAVVPAGVKPGRIHGIQILSIAFFPSLCRTLP